MTETPNTETDTWVGETVNIVGWMTFFSSVCCGLCMKGGSGPYGSIDYAPVGFFSSLGILAIGSLVYWVGAHFSNRWRSKTMQSRFTPYLLGLAGWACLVLFLGIVGG